MIILIILVIGSFLNGHTHSGEMYARGAIPPVPLELWLAHLRDTDPKDPSQFYLSALLTVSMLRLLIIIFTITAIKIEKMMIETHRSSAGRGRIAERRDLRVGHARGALLARQGIRMP